MQSLLTLYKIKFENHKQGKNAHQRGPQIQEIIHINKISNTDSYHLESP